MKYTVITESLLVGCGESIYVLDFTSTGHLLRVRVYGAKGEPYAVIVDSNGECVAVQHDMMVTGRSDCNRLLDSIEVCARNGAPMVVVNHISRRWAQLYEPSPASMYTEMVYGDPSRVEAKLILRVLMHNGAPRMVEYTTDSHTVRCTDHDDRRALLEAWEENSYDALLIDWPSCLETLATAMQAYENLALINMIEYR